jgi:hypothetical protein
MNGVEEQDDIVYVLTNEAMPKNALSLHQVGTGYGGNSGHQDRHKADHRVPAVADPAKVE